MGFESEFKFFKKEFKTVKLWSRPIIHDQFYTENLPILGGQKAAVSDSVNGWCAADNIVQTDGQRDDVDGWRDGRVQGLSVATIRPESGEGTFFLYNIWYGYE
jgi:hypothetical protein